MEATAAKNGAEFNLLSRCLLLKQKSKTVLHIYECIGMISSCEHHCSCFVALYIFCNIIHAGYM